jgi:glutaredoxin-related protein
VFKRSSDAPAQQDVLVPEALRAKLEKFWGWKTWERESLAPSFTGGGPEILCRWLQNHGRPGNQGQARFARRLWRPLISMACP